MSCTCKQQKGLQIVKAGFLRKYKRGFLSKGFKVVYVELTKDCYLLWYRDQSSYKRDGCVQLREVCDYLAVGPYTRSIPGRPYLPRSLSERHLIAVPSSPSRDSHVYWFICCSDIDLNNWMTCISHVLPPPNKKLSDVGTYLPRDPPPPYTSQGPRNEVEKSGGDIHAGGDSHRNGLGQVTTVQPVNSLPDCAWGWTWGWGGAWGCPGWNYFSFSPSDGTQTAAPSSSSYFQETNADLIKNGDISANHQDCQMTDQPLDQIEYDAPDLDPCCDTFCDPSFDAAFDAGATFDIGFSIGF